MRIQKKSDHTLKNLWKWTISAQLHGVMALLSLPAGWWLLVKVAPQGNGWAFLITVYALASTFVFSASALYHFISDGFECHKEIERWLNRMDHVAIVFMIAASYSAVAVRVLEMREVIVLLFFVCTLSTLIIVHIFLKSRLPYFLGGRAISTFLYLALGCMGLWILPSLYKALTTVQLTLLLTGGGIYVLGAIIYYLEKYRKTPRHFDLHEVWHVAVMLAYSTHYFMMLSIYKTSTT